VISRNRTSTITPSLFFVTTTLRDWRPRFQDKKIADEFQTLLFSVSLTHASALMGYVVMPEHVHLLVGCQRGEQQLSKFLQALKSLSARRLFAGEGSVWMERYAYFTVTNERQFKIKIDYIHQNPVRRELVATPLDWKWSSASFWVNDEPHPVLRKDWVWMEG